jgi:hypothetical protein
MRIAVSGKLFDCCVEGFIAQFVNIYAILRSQAFTTSGAATYKSPPRRIAIMIKPVKKGA